MNDITPPKPAKQDIQDNSELASNAVKTNVQPDIKTNVGRPIRHWGKWLLLVLLVLPLLAVAFYGVQQWRKANKTYKVGSHSFTYGDVEDKAAKMKKGFSGKPNAQVQAQMLSDAKDKLALLAGLKDEADKRNIGYDKAAVDGYMNARYAEKGGKAQYMANMKQSFGWTEHDVYDFGTTLFLQSRLESDLLAQKQFTIIYVRWDGIKLFDPQNYKTTYNKREAELRDKYLPPLKQGDSLDILRNLVEVSDTANEATTKVVYQKTKNAPIQIQSFNPNGVTFNNYNEGEDVMTRLNSIKEAGGTTGPFKGADGRLIIARLEKSQGGTYYGWDDFIRHAKQQAGVTINQSSKSINFSAISKRVTQALRSSALSPQKAEAAQEALDCLAANHSVRYNFSVWRTDNGDRIWSPSYTMSGSGSRQVVRNDAQEDVLGHYYCDPTIYSRAGWSIGPADANGFATISISKSSSYGVLTIISDCWGYPIAIGAQPPSLGPDWVYDHGGDPYGTYGNGTTINKDFYYRPATSTTPPPQDGPSCKFTDAHRVDATRWSVSWVSSNYFGTRIGGKLYNSVSGGTDTSVSASESDHKVQVADGKTGTVTFTLTNEGNDIVSCSTNVGQGTSNPPPQPPPVGPPPPITPGCNAAPLTADTSINPWVAAFDAIPRGSVPPPPSSITVEPGQPVYVLGYIQKGMNPRIPGYVYRWTIDPSANTSGPNLKGGYIDNKAFVSFNVTAPNEAVTMTYTLKADVNSEAGGIIESSCSAVIIVKSKPLAPTANPWLQTKRGNVLAIGYVQSQLVGSAAGRPATSADKEAEHVIMGYLGSTVKDSNFCSTMGYDFGTITANKCQYSNASGSGYAAKVPNGIGTSSDPAITSLNVAVTGRNGVPVDTCSDKVPYKLNDLGTATTVALGNLGATDVCPVVIYSKPAGGGFNLDATTISQGRGTLYVNGNVTVNGNIAYNYGSGRFSSINTIPNFGIVATGNILIAPSVTSIDASLYALGKVKTCSGAYPSAACNVKLTIRGKLAAANGFELGRSYWTGNPADTTNPTSPESAEFVIGSGLIEAFPPPGFVDLTGGLGTVQYLSREANPRF